MRNMVKITAAVLALTMLTSCGQLDDTSKAETKATSATVTTPTLGTWKPSFENATTFTTTTTATTTTTSQTTTTKTTTTKKTTTTVQNNDNGGVVYYPSQDNNNYYYEDNQPSYNENNGDNGYSYEQPQQTEQQTTTTKKVEQQSKPSGNKITQADIDAMKAELTAYSREKAEYIKAHYTEFWKYGTDFNTLEEFFELKEGSVTPETASYDAVYTVPYTQSSLSDTIEVYKSELDYLYNKYGNTYYVVYIQNCPSGNNVNSNPCWAIYFLY